MVGAIPYMFQVVPYCFDVHHSYFFLQSRWYFVYDYSGEALNPVSLWTKSSFRNLISLHPIKDPQNMLSVHHFYKTLELEEAYKELHESAEYLNQLCKRLAPHVAPPLSTSAGCYVKLHPPQLTRYNESSKMGGGGGGGGGGNPSSTSWRLIHRESVPFFLKPTSKFDVQYWTHFNDTRVQDITSASFAPEFSPQGSLLAEIRHALRALRPYMRAQHAPRKVEIKHVVDGYLRFNPHLGREYRLTLKLAVDESTTVYKRYHVVREIGPLVSVVDLPLVHSSQVIHVILPLQQVGRAFTEFLKSFQQVGLKHKENALRLVLVVSSRSLQEQAEKAMREFAGKGEVPLSVTIAANTASQSSHLKAFDAGMATLEDDRSLALLASTRLRFGPGFFRHCRANSELGKRVYFPVPFWLYRFDNYTEFLDGRAPPLTSWMGQWANYDFTVACIYKRDYEAVGGYHDAKYTVDLFNAVAASHYDVVQAPEPGLFKAWPPTKCSELASEKRRRICADLKRRSSFEQAYLADYLVELSAIHENILSKNYFFAHAQ